MASHRPGNVAPISCLANWELSIGCSSTPMPTSARSAWMIAAAAVEAHHWRDDLAEHREQHEFHDDYIAQQRQRELDELDRERARGQQR